MRFGKGDFHCLHLQVNAIGGVKRVNLNIEMFEDTERQQRGDSLPIRWNLMNGKAPKVLGDTVDPVTLVIC